MTKNIFIISIMCCVALFMQAQQSVGQWQLYPTKVSAAGVIYEGIDDEVYYLSGKNLFSFNKATQEISTYNSGNSLSDNDIENIYYNYNKGYLMIVYQNSNIDLLYSDNEVVNMPDLKNTLMMSSKAINDVVFYEDKIYIATDFGLIILNDEKYEVYESYIYNKVIEKLDKTDKYLAAVIDGNLYITTQKSALYDFASSWETVNISSIKANDAIFKHMLFLNDKQILFNYNYETYIYDVDDDSITKQNTNIYYAFGINETVSGFLVFFDTNYRYLSTQTTEDNYLVFDAVYGISDAKAKNGFLSCYNTNNEVWCNSSYGVSLFTAENTNFKWLMMPCSYNTTSVEVPQYIQVFNNKVYVKNMGPYNYSVDMSNPTSISVYDLSTREWSDMTLDKVVRGGVLTSTGVLRSSLNMAFDVDDSDIFYIGSWFDGLHKFDGTTYVGNYNTENSPLSKPWSMMAAFTDFDPDGNLWTIMVNNKMGENSILACLPADKKNTNPTDIKSSDWITYDIGADLSYWNYLLVCKKSPFVIVVHAGIVSSTRLTVVNRNTGESRLISTLIDQDGGSFGNGVLNFLTAEEDNNGNIWIGTTSGPIVLNNIKNIMNTNYRCTRVKVPRNDGTNYADYLLEDETINTIVVDGANRKWLGTATTGVYLVNENGSEILEHYSTDNSIIPSNMIYDMDMDEASGELFVVTDLGVASYRSTVSNAANNYNSVTVFPNPVRPEYNGWITIQGLMENSLVKITDVAGNLFVEGYSNGGTFVWDGRTSQGERVKTGVYLIYASQSGGTSGVVAKVMVVN